MRSHPFNAVGAPASTHSRFLRAVDFVEEHLMEPVALADAAKEAGLSLHYFSRLFRVLTGEPFGAYLRRRRMTVAAERLVTRGPDVRLVELAFDCGYDSQEAFTRAFKRTLGVTPGAYRARRPIQRMRWRRRIDAEELTHLSEVLSMEPEICEIESFAVAGVRERFDEATKKRIPALWNRFLSLLPDIPHQLPGTYGLCTNANPNDGSFDYVAGVAVERVDRLPEAAIAESVPRQTYAVFRHQVRSLDLHAELQPTVRWIWSTWLPASDFEYLGGPDFERYPEGFERRPGNHLDIAVPVRRRAR
jgi:AraC family transcriptional regulator